MLDTFHFSFAENLTRVQTMAYYMVRDGALYLLLVGSSLCVKLLLSRLDAASVLRLC